MERNLLEVIMDEEMSDNEIFADAMEFSKSERCGEIEETYIYEEKKFEWKIPNLPSVMDPNGDYEFGSPKFSFAGSLWYMTMIPQPAISNDLDETMILCLRREKEDIDFSAFYTIGVKKIDGSVQNCGRGIFKRGKLFDFDCDILSLRELQERKSMLVPADVLTICCTLQSEIPRRITLERPKFRKLGPDTLSWNFRKLFANKESCDTVLLVKGTEYKAHKAVLIARSPVFAAMFQHDMKEKQTGIISITDCDAPSFEAFLEYLYNGELRDPSYCSVLHLYKTSEKYDVQELKAFCRGYLIETLTVERFCDVVIFADKYNDTELLTGAQWLFNKSIEEILELPEWENLWKHNYRLVKFFLKGIGKVVKRVYGG